MEIVLLTHKGAHSGKYIRMCAPFLVFRLAHSVNSAVE